MQDTSQTNHSLLTLAHGAKPRILRHIRNGGSWFSGSVKEVNVVLPGLEVMKVSIYGILIMEQQTRGKAAGGTCS